jgi:HK97 family phage major capsid protein
MEEVQSSLQKMFEGIKLPKEMQHDGSKANTSIELPIVAGSHNMSVGSKQLLNIIMGSAPQDTIEASKIYKGVRPLGMNEGISKDQLARAKAYGDASIQSARNASLYGGKALTAGGAGTGAEFTNTDLSSDLLSRLYLESQLAATMIAGEMQMPTDPYKLPFNTTRPSFRLGSEGGTPTKSTPATTNPTLDAFKLIGEVEYSYEADEESIIAMLPFLQESLGAAAAASYEDALINGDLTATHQDSDTQSVSLHPAKAVNGFRALALAGSLATSLATGGITAANIRALLKTMGKYGIRPQDLIIIAGTNAYNDILGLEETLTADKVGSDVARILTGLAPTLYGSKIVVSASVREDLNASGVFDGSTMTKGSILIVHRPSFIVGVRRGFTVEVDRNISTQMRNVVASFRRAFTPLEAPSATVPSVVMGYNYPA